MDAYIPTRVAAIVGGSTAGAEAAARLADQGVRVVVFDQNPRPYGKIEDGLPRWHLKLRRKEYETICRKLDLPGVHFVPLTKIGRDLDFRALATQWGFSAVLLALGAWRDRPFPVEGADAYVNRGFLYQNPFIHWFNHYHERDYSGVQHEIPDGAVVVGGGLGSIDVVKAIQIETARRALLARGIVEDVIAIEHAGVIATLEKHGTSMKKLGLRGATLYYRRRIEDMPLSDIPADTDAEKRRKLEAARRRIVERAMEKFGFHVQPQRLPVGLIVDNDRLVGLTFRRTEAAGSDVRLVEGSDEEVRTPLVISSVGSVPEPMPGIGQRGLLYRFSDPELGRVEGYENVFATGNVVTGKGNILVSRRHSVVVSTHVIENFLGVADEGSEEDLMDAVIANVDETADRVADFLTRRPPLREEAFRTLMRRVRMRQAEVGHVGTFREWMEKITPPDLV